MNGPYTLRQVRSVNVFAEWHGSQGGFDVSVLHRPDGWEWATWVTGDHVGPFTVTMPEDGWMHRPGCDCEFCREPDR